MDELSMVDYLFSGDHEKSELAGIFYKLPRDAQLLRRAHVKVVNTTGTPEIVWLD